MKTVNKYTKIFHTECKDYGLQLSPETLLKRYDIDDVSSNLNVLSPDAEVGFWFLVAEQAHSDPYCVFRLTIPVLEDAESNRNKERKEHIMNGLRPLQPIKYY